MDEQDLYWVGIDLANGLLSGAMIGGYYALISVGLALNFGVMRLVNLSHGDWLIVAAYLCVSLLTMVPVAPWWSLVIVVPLMYAIGYGVQRCLLNHVSVQAAERRGMSPVFGLMLPLLRGALEYARRQGAQTVEAYPRVNDQFNAAESYMGRVSVLEQAGFREAAAPSEKRRVMRCEIIV